MSAQRREFVDGIKDDLKWLGLLWDKEFCQSERFSLYEDAAAKLKRAGRLYACYETAEELERRRKRQMARGLPPIYDRAALTLSNAEKDALEASGRKPHWRFLLDRRATAWVDLIRGPQEIDAASVSDPVLVREDRTPLYTFTGVVDDAQSGITHIIRGEDHVTNTAVQIQIFEALGFGAPEFAHHNLLTSVQGEALSKRLGSLSIAGLRDEGLEPLAVVTHASLIGTSSEALQPHHSLDELARHIDGGEPFWLTVRANLEVFADVDRWWKVVQGPVTPIIEDAAFVDKALALLPGTPWDSRTWTVWTEAVKQATGAKGRALYHPLRLALTGFERGPELRELLPLIGRSKAVLRLSGKPA